MDVERPEPGAGAASAAVAETRRHAVESELDAALDQLGGGPALVPASITAEETDLQMVKRVEVPEAVADAAGQCGIIGE